MSTTFKLLCLTLALSCVTTVAAGKTCKALVLEAGGDLGAYEAGVVQGLVQSYAKLGQLEEVQWDVFSGVSVGALNAAYLNQFSKSETEKMAEGLVSLWQNIKKSDVYKNYLGGVVQGLVFESSLYKTDPLKAFITKNLNKKQQRKLSIGATNANTGDFTRFTESLSTSDLVQALMASSAVPGLFPYQIFQGNTYFDGGLIRATDVEGAIQRCLEIVDDASQITLDVVLITSKHINSDIEVPLHPIKVGTLANNIKQYNNSRRSLLEAQDYYPQINWRYIINPKKSLPNADVPFGFKEGQLKAMIEQGNAEAVAAVAEHQVITENLEKVGDHTIDNLSLSARRVFMEAYESLFERYDVDVDTYESA